MKPARTLNLALLGSGKMGTAIAALAPHRGFHVKLILDEVSNRNFQAITAENFSGVDAAIDFTIPDAAVENIRRCAAIGIPLVVGTTGWYDRLGEVRQIVENAGSGLVYAANFSIGVALFYRAAKAMAEIFERFPAYEPYILETHHRFKKDAPSGTAAELKRQITKSREIPITSVRAGYFPGTHELGFDSEADTVILRHTARGRQGFAEGALAAARWIIGKKGFHNFSEVLE